MSPSLLNESSRYMPLVGWIVGGLSALVFLGLSKLMQANVAIVLTMAFGIYLTGAFHEDGLADTADGLGGGWTIEQKLEIMKDSRLGSFGGAALVLALLLKQQALSICHSPALALLVAHPLSRFVAVSMIYFSQYVRQDEKSKVKPLAKAMSLSAWLFALVTALVALCLIPGQALQIALALVTLFVLARRFLHQQLGGFTGDTLGGLQQVAELMIYVLLTAL